MGALVLVLVVASSPTYTRVVRIGLQLVGVCVLAGASCVGQEAPPVDMGWVPVAQAPYAVDNPLCVSHNRVASCTFPGPIYAWNVKLALKGNVEAAYQVGLAYLQGWGVKQDLARAEYWFLIGAQSPYEKHWVGDQYRWGRYFAKSLERTDSWYRAAGDHFSLHELALIYRMGTLGKPEAAKAVALDLELLRGGDGYARLAEFELGNMVIDGQYSSSDRRQDLRWAREIAQELIGQEEYKLAWASGSGMDLAGTPEVERAVVRSAASFDVDLAQTRMSAEFPAMSLGEHYAWVRLAGRNQQAVDTEANGMSAAMSPAERDAGEAVLKALERTRQMAGGYYRNDDPLLAPDFAELERSASKFGDPEEQLRLAYHEEADVGGSTGFAKAMELYRLVRDQRVGGVRLRIGNEYLWGTNGFPRDAERAAKWYGFAAKAGSSEACARLAEMKATGC